MGELSPIHWLLVLAIIVILFGGKRIPEVMRGMGEGIRSFKEGMRNDGTVQPTTTQVPPTTTTTTTPVQEKK